jgi:hypothetical protein
LTSPSSPPIPETDTSPMVRECLFCRGEGTDPRYGWEPPCPVCEGMGGYRYEWVGDTYIFYGPVDPAQAELAL